MILDFDPETIDELEHAFTALSGPDDYEIRFPIAMSRELSREDCDEILNRTLEFAAALLEEKSASYKSRK